jgi:RecJ-like exonuclease
MHSQPCDNSQCQFGVELKGVHEWDEPDYRDYITNEHGEVIDYVQYYTHYEVPEYGTCTRCHGLGQILVCDKCGQTVDFEEAERNQRQTMIPLFAWSLLHDSV